MNDVPALIGRDAGTEDLLAAAKAVRDHAYAPYSGFAVGAAVRTANGAIYAAPNVENAAYPIGTCAEAGAIAAMVSAGERRIVEVLVFGPGPSPITPCGACRQRIWEFADPETPIHAADSSGIVARFTLGQLLPHAFGPDQLPPSDLGPADVCPDKEDLASESGQQAR